MAAKKKASRPPGLDKALGVLEKETIEAAKKHVTAKSTAGFEIADDWIGPDVAFRLVVDGAPVEITSRLKAWPVYLSARAKVAAQCQKAYDDLEAKNPMAEALVTGKSWKPIVEENKQLRECLLRVLNALKTGRVIAKAEKIPRVSGSG